MIDLLHMTYFALLALALALAVRADFSRRASARQRRERDLSRQPAPVRP